MGWGDGTGRNEIQVFRNFVVLDSSSSWPYLPEGHSFSMYERACEVESPFTDIHVNQDDFLVGLREAGRQIAGYVCLAGTRSENELKVTTCMFFDSTGITIRCVYYTRRLPIQCHAPGHGQRYHALFFILYLRMIWVFRRRRHSSASRCPLQFAYAGIGRTGTIAGQLPAEAIPFRTSA